MQIELPPIVAPLRKLYFLKEKVTNRITYEINSQYISSTITNQDMSKYNSLYVWYNVHNDINRNESLIDFKYHTTDSSEMK